MQLHYIYIYIYICLYVTCWKLTRNVRKSNNTERLSQVVRQLSVIDQDSLPDMKNGTRCVITWRHVFTALLSHGFTCKQLMCSQAKTMINFSPRCRCCLLDWRPWLRYYVELCQTSVELGCFLLSGRVGFLYP